LHIDDRSRNPQLPIIDMFWCPTCSTKLRNFRQYFECFQLAVENFTTP